MNKENPSDCCKKEMFFKKHHGCKKTNSSSIYGFGFVGALIYYVQGASTFGAVMFAIGKAIFWPAILLFKVFTLLQL